MTINAASSGPSRRGWWLVAGVLGVAAAGLAIRVAIPSGPANSAQSATSEGVAAFDPQAASAETIRVERDLEIAIRTGANGSAALQAAQKLAHDYPRFAPAHTLLARGLTLAGQPVPAYDECLLSLKLDPRNAPTLGLAGKLALQNGKIEEALRHYSDASDLDNAKADYRFGLAQAYLDHRDRDRARRAVLDGLQIAPDAHEGYAVLSELFAQENKVSMALEKITKAIALVPKEQQAVFAAYTRRESALLRRDNQPQAALAALQRLGSASDATAEVLEDQAVCLAMMGQPGKAAELFEQAAKARPNEPALRAGAERWRHKADMKK
ncbi:MAG: tetratricopeptide repeat protein [Planctomycetota bacterium]|nr:tetratricopeptide repeat protein [Planctomycetota bacterium]